MYLYCVRHGESVFNAEGRIQGQQDPPLSDLGRRQAQAVAARLEKLPIKAVFSSPLDRARSTAEPIAEALGVEIETDDRLKEIHVGVFQGMLWADVQNKHPEFAEKWRSQDPDYVIPEGESRRQLMQRGAAALHQVQQAGYEHVVGVAHGALLAAAFKTLFEIPARLNPFTLHNASITKIKWDGQFRLKVFNHIQHLVDADVAPDGAADL